MDSTEHLLSHTSAFLKVTCNINLTTQALRLTLLLAPGFFNNTRRCMWENEIPLLCSSFSFFFTRYLQYGCPFNLTWIYVYVSTPEGNIIERVICISVCVFVWALWVKDKEVTDLVPRRPFCALVFFMLPCSIIKLTEFRRWPGWACLLSIYEGPLRQRHMH